MKLPSFRLTVVIILIVIGLMSNPAPAVASFINWTDWTASGASSVSGTMAGVTVTYTGSYAFAQLAGGTNYWLPTAPYLSGTVSNAPDTIGTDIVALSLLGTKTLTFSAAVMNPVIAFVSWNGNPQSFTLLDGNTLTYLSGNGVAGFWGAGTSVVNGSSTGFTSTGEFHGVYQINGLVSSITFADGLNENWHGFSVGIADAQTTPEPSSIALTVLGGLGLLAVARRRR